MNSKLEKLLSPLKLGPKTVPNRFVFASHLTNFGFDNVFTERHAAYYTERAQGGVGIIVLEEMSVHSSDWPYPRTILGYKETCVEGLRKVREAIKAANPQTLVLAQLNHLGGQGTDNITQREILAPSAVQDIISRQVPKAMEVEDIKAVVAGFAKTARHVKQAGLDGLEINIADRSLVRQFLSGLTNFRGDDYGGSIENKLRFALEVIEAVRTAVGPDLIVGIKLCGDELAPWAGLTAEQGQAVGVALAQSGKLDYISVMMGSIYSLDKASASMHTAPGFATPLAAGMRKALREANLNLPVIATGRIQDPILAADLLAEESADLIEMTRALISDPELPNKVKNGRLASIRYCTACNQDCQVRSTMNPLLTCVHNAAAGEEARYSDSVIGRAAKSRKVFIIGGGPAGMEAARVATLRGHNITLYEKNEKLGGSLNSAAAGPGRENWKLTINYLKGQLEQLGVEVRCPVTVTPELIEAERPDVVIVATGGRSVPLYHVAVAEGASVLWARQFIAAPDNFQVGPNVVIVDEVGSFPAVSAAEILANRGHKVTIVTHDPFISRELTSSLDMNGWYGRALAMGIQFMPQKYVRNIEARAVVLEDIHSHAEERLEEIDSVILANYEYPNDTLYHNLKALPGRTFELYRVGDCVAARKVGHAIREANKVARKL